MSKQSEPTKKAPSSESHTSPMAQPPIVDQTPSADFKQPINNAFVMMLQRTIGNQRVQRFLKAPQNLISRHPDDGYSETVKTQSEKVKASRAKAEEDASTIEDIQRYIEEMRVAIGLMKSAHDSIVRDGWKKPAKLLLTNAEASKLKVEGVLAEKQANALAIKNAQGFQKQALSIASNLSTKGIQSVKIVLKQTRDGLQAVISASTLEAIQLGLKNTEDASVKCTDALNKYASFIVTIGELKAKSDLELDKIVNSPSGRAAILDVSKTIKASEATATEAQTVAAELDMFAKRAVGRAKTIADAKILAIQKAEEATLARANADQLKQVLEEAKKAADKLKEVLVSVQNDVEGLQSIKTKCEKAVQAADETLKKAIQARADLLVTFKENDVEVYFQDGMLNSADNDIDIAQELKRVAEQELLVANENLVLGQQKLGGAQDDFNVADAKATNVVEIEKAKTAESTAVKLETETKDAQTQAPIVTNAQSDLNAQDIREQNELEELAGLAGGKNRLNALLMLVPDKTELKGLFTHMNFDLLNACLTHPTIGVVKTKLFNTTFGASIPTFVADLTAAKVASLVANLSVPDLKTIHDDLTYEKFKVMAQTWEGAFIGNVVTEFTLVKFCEWFKELDFIKVHNLIVKATLPKVKDLTTQYTALLFKPYLTDFTADQITDFLSEFTATELKAYVVELTYDRLKVLVKTKEITAKALKKYTAAWLKTFVGVSDATMDHLTDLVIKNNGVVSGGHDKQSFYAALDTVIRPASVGVTQVKQGTYNTTQTATNYIKVHYDTFQNDGTAWGAGSKTLISNLVAQKDAWKTKFDKAVWKAIADCTFVRVNPNNEYTITGYKGFYVDAETAVRTIFPTT